MKHLNGRLAIKLNCTIITFLFQNRIIWKKHARQVAQITQPSSIEIWKKIYDKT